MDMLALTNAVLWLISLAGSAGLFACIVIGFRALMRAIRGQGSSRYLFLALALSLIEPGINTFVVSFTAFFSVRQPGEFMPSLPLTSSMAVLLLPIIGLALPNPYYARLCGLIAALGLARWANSAFMINGIIGDPAFIREIMFVTVPLGIVLLIFSAFWGNRILRANSE
jgi:hypothetical protein